ncbi:MAG: glycosyltransferase [Gammaproteobacteria bacterium]|nr:glycosyltransferase [Gammaproteobacteria bacterium]
MTTSIQDNDLKLSIVIPVYNEHENIEHTIHSIKRNIRSPHEIIAIYDDESDTTIPVLNRLKNQFSGLNIIKNAIKIGPSGAIRTGINASQAPLVLVMMADLCDDISQVESFIKLIPHEADIVCPSRYCEGGSQELSESPKKWLPKFAGIIMHHIAGLPYDSTNSYKLYSKKVLDELELISTSSFSVTLEIVVKAKALGYSLVEIPTTWKDRQFGKSKFKLITSIITYLPWFIFAISNGLLNIFSSKQSKKNNEKKINKSNSS